MVKWPKMAVPPKIGGTLFEVICAAGASEALPLCLLSSRPAPGGRGAIDPGRQDFEFWIFDGSVSFSQMPGVSKYRKRGYPRSGERS